MPFGLSNAPSSFQRVISMVMSGMLWHDILPYLDDIIVLGVSFEDHTINLCTTLVRFRDHHLNLKAKKGSFFQVEAVFLGPLIPRDGVKINPDNLVKVKDWPVPTSVKELQAFWGFMNYHRDPVADFAGIAAELYMSLQNHV